MGLLKNLFGNAQEASEHSTTTKPNIIYSPLNGTVIPLDDIGDGVFSEGILGQGCGIRPSSETIMAPFDGTVVQIAETKHAISIKSRNGIEILIHIGIDTIAMNGKGFKVHTSAGNTVTCGQKLLSFDKAAIAAAGHPDTTAVIITNSNDYHNIALCKTGSISATEGLFTI